MKEQQKRNQTTKDIGLLMQLFEQGQLLLAPEFQRQSVWPRAAKQYLIDTILSDKPIPLIFLQRATSPQTGRQTYSVIDGQQRLRAVFEFCNDFFPLSAESGNLKGRFFSDLSPTLRNQVLNYSLMAEELIGYSEQEIKDVFVRMNRYGIKLSAQELRHAKFDGAFHSFVQDIGSWPIWKEERVFTTSQLKRLRAEEFAAELVILLLEGPQDKKSAINLYYDFYRDNFTPGSKVERQLEAYLNLVLAMLPTLSETRYRKPVDLYALVGAIDIQTNGGKSLNKIDITAAGRSLLTFEKKIKSDTRGEPARYAIAASRQTDNLTPRQTRIDILRALIS